MIDTRVKYIIGCIRVSWLLYISVPNLVVWTSSTGCVRSKEQVPLHLYRYCHTSPLASHKWTTIWIHFSFILEWLPAYPPCCKIRPAWNDPLVNQEIQCWSQHTSDCKTQTVTIKSFDDTWLVGRRLSHSHCCYAWKLWCSQVLNKWIWSWPCL